MLKGERVLLRPMMPEDIACKHEYNQDMELAVLTCDTPRVSPPERAQSFYEIWTKPDDDFAGFIIEADGKYIGDCCLGNLRERHGSLELGIAICDPAYWSKGYGREVVNLLLDYGFRSLGARRIWLTCHSKNERAIRSFKSCGFIEEGRPRKAIWVAGAYIDLVDMSMLRDEWLASHSKF